MIVPGTRITRRVRLVSAAILAAAVLVGLGIATAPLSRVASTTPASHSTAASPVKRAVPAALAAPARPTTMTAHPVSDYAGAAAKLPTGLTTALRRDSDLSGAQWLANSAAAIQAVKVVAALKVGGVHVLGSSMDGTRLTVNVASARDVAAVRAAGATAIIGAAKVRDFSTIKFTALSTINTYGGQGYFYSATPNSDEGAGYRCSIGFNGYSAATGASQFATAGHCATAIPSGNDTLLVGQSAPAAVVGDNNLDLVALMGTEASSNGTPEGSYGNYNDYGIVTATNPDGDPAVRPQSALATWGGGSGAAVSTHAATSSTLAITGETVGMVGDTMCKSGSSSGWTCGKILALDESVDVSDERVNAIVATTCLLGGDSGGGAVIGSDAVAIDSGGDNVNADDYTSKSCTNPKGTDGAAAYSVFFPMISTSSSVNAHSVQNQVGSKWQLAITVSSPIVSSPVIGHPVARTASISGTLANASSTSIVKLYLDGSGVAAATASAASGSWSFPLSSVSAGTHSYQLIASSGYSVGTATTGAIRVYVPVPVDRDGGAGDINSDGTADLLARDSSGTLWLYPGDGAGGLRSRVSLGTASGAFASATAIIPAGDFNGDSDADVILRDASGTLWLYPGNGNGGFGAPQQVATGFGAMTAIQNVGDFNGDGAVDLIARDSSGVLWLYPGNGTGGLGNRVQLSTGWGSMSAILGVGDFTGDGHPDIITRDSTGTLWLYPGTGSSLGARISIGSGWTGYTIASVGDFNGDGYADIVARDSRGTLWLYPGNGSNGFLARVQLATSFTNLTIAGDGAGVISTTPISSAVSVGTDLDGDGDRDLLLRDPVGNLVLDAGNGADQFTSKSRLAAGWQGLSEITPVGDFNGDGHPDVIARDAAGTLWLYPGNGSGGLGTRVLLASNWQVMTAIVGIGDFNRDTHPDLLARDAHGVLWLYPGTGSDSLAAPISLGTGWSGKTLVAAGDFNGDGNQDLIERDASGALWLYEGNGSNGWLARVALGSGFGAYTLAGAGSS